MVPKPTLIFVPGSWHTAQTWDKVTTLLTPLGYKSISITLPSTTGNPSATFKDDIDAVQAAIKAETTQGRDVVIVEHSYGGQVGNSAVKGFTRPKDDVTGSSGFVIGIAMIATGFTATGISFIDGLGGKPPPFWHADEETGFIVLTADCRDLFYHDLPAAEGEEWVSKLTTQSTKSLFGGGEYSYAGWKDVPVWYLATVEDHGLPFEVQKMFVQMARDAGADATLREIGTSHSPMLSKPEETVAFIVDAVNAFVG